MLPKSPKHWHCSLSHMLLGSLFLCSAVNRSPAALLEPHQSVKQENPTAPFGAHLGCTHRCHSDTFYNLTAFLCFLCFLCFATVKRAGTDPFLCNEGCPGTQCITWGHSSALKPHRGTVQHTNSKFQHTVWLQNIQSCVLQWGFSKEAIVGRGKSTKASMCNVAFSPYFSHYSSDCKPCLCGKKQLLISPRKKPVLNTKNATEEDFRQH